MYILNEEVAGYSEEIGWKTKFICKEMDHIIANQK